METINSPSNQKIKDLVRLKDGKGELYLVEGFHLVEEAYKHGYAEAIYATKPYPVKEVPVTLISEAVLKRLSSSVTPEGIVALCRKKPFGPLTSNRLLIIDGVQDPGNVGTLLRTALAFGFRDVLSIQGSASAYSSKVLLASQGALFQLNLKEKASREEALEILKPYYVVATDLRGQPMEGHLYRGEKKLALVLGNEARGVDEAFLKRADYRSFIAMKDIDSLNVAVAGGIAMHHYAEGK